MKPFALNAPSVKFPFLYLIALFNLSSLVISTVVGQSSSYRIPTPALSFLTLAPDARGAALGESGVASNPDVNSTYWNASKLAFAERGFGASASYTPWLRNITDDMWLGYASIYKKIDSKQAIALSANFFNNEYVDLNIAQNQYFTNTANSKAFSISYAAQLGKSFSLGLTAKYLTSDLSGPVTSNILVKPARTFAADLSAFYRKKIMEEVGGREMSWSFGAVISNLGGKVSYLNIPDTDQFIPSTLKLGAGFSVSPNGNHHFNFILDGSKLLVPTPNNNNNFATKPYIQGVIQSFSDAPGGFKEEIQEVNLSGGAEYWYKNVFALRGGYHGQNKNKGDLKYFTAGAGLQISNNYGVDFAYLFPVEKGSPLAQTFRITASVYLGKNGKSGSFNRKI